MVEVTAHLDDQGFANYLQAVTILLDHAFGQCDSGVPELDQLRHAEDVMAEEAPESLNLISAVHLRVLGSVS